MLIAMAGLPASGKSTLARELARTLPAAFLSVDPVESAMLQAGFDKTDQTGLASYLVVETIAADLLATQHVIIDAVNDDYRARQQWINLAENLRTHLRWIEVTCSDTHTHRHRLETRVRGLVGIPEPDWASVQSRRVGLESWDDDRLVLDSMRPLTDNLDRALDHCAVIASA